MLTNLYIYGFNLYYRPLKDGPFRWLGLRMLAENLFPQDAINRVCYFTLLLDAWPDNPLRSLVYLRTLVTLPGLEIHYGQFRSGVKRRSLAEPAPGLPGSMLFRDSEVKGSDVNLATHLLVDGFNGEYEQSVVLFNDADFAGTMRYVKDKSGLRFTLVNPDSNNNSSPGIYPPPPST